MAMRMSAGRASAVRLVCGVAAATLALAGMASAEDAAKPAAKPAAAKASSTATNLAKSPDQRLYNGPEIPAAQDLTGVWQLSSYDPALRPIDGKPLPYTDAGKAGLAKNATRKTREGGKNVCQPLGTPRAYISPYPIMFVQVPRNLITIYHEENRSYRLVRLDAEHMDPGPWDPSYVGESVAKWDGDSLVIDTVGFNDKGTFEDGVYHTAKLHVTERISKSADGKWLVMLYTYDDPGSLKMPFKFARILPFFPSDTMVQQEDSCPAGRESY